MKRLFFATGILLTALTGNAQKSNLKFSGGLNIGIPAHNLGGTSLGLGVDVMALYPLSTQATITGDFGYTALFAKNAKYTGATTTNLLPLRVGLRYYPSGNFFVAGKIGAGFISNSGSSITTTAYSFGLGYAFTPKIELGGSYDGYSNDGTVGLVNFRVAYFFN
jgi:hypothetical protein